MTQHSVTNLLKTCPKCEISYNIQAQISSAIIAARGESDTSIWNDKCPNCEEQAAFNNGPWKGK